MKEAAAQVRVSKMPVAGTVTAMTFLLATMAVAAYAIRQTLRLSVDAVESELARERLGRHFSPSVRDAISKSAAGDARRESREVTVLSPVS